MKIDILTIFPKMFAGPFDESIVKRAQDKGLIDISIHNLRDWGIGARKTVDDRPYSGGAGMILMVEPIFKALSDLKTKDSHIILLTAQGKIFDQKKAFDLSKRKHIILICGHYEGFDQRIADYLVNEEISIGQYVLTGGELPAMIITDTITRLIPNVLSKPHAIALESFSKEGVLEHPQYTRPEAFQGWKVPKILLSGDHKKITKWKEKNSPKL